MAQGPFIIPLSKQAKQTIGVEWADFLESGETITGVTVDWETEGGDDASSLESGSPFVDGTRVKVTKAADQGTPGSYYFVIFTATTSTGRKLGGDQTGTIKLKITKNH